MPGARHNTKLKGELAEVLFMERALRLGYVVSKPYGDSAPYDLVVGGAGRGLLRVQVKSVWATEWRGVYRVKSNCHAYLKYTAEEIDFLAACVAAESAWYIIPVEAFTPRTTLRLNPRDPEHDQWGAYRESWALLGEPRMVRG